ncbi:PREDICTED: peptidyl-prolyl cis-trans isomerase CWC27 homolog [Nanorana parkeri]|uniref:peptidyl-prolyl cis-trans isomerase CWC27 homolog n=1 Tax=Nanorana parkeri TaxID=125878 RepID=UPI000854A070|nr:PREDICTED: peptidyl-prolyl cis-trans isomerase CWC27 homolog [Nanorana parkeri]
MSNIYIQEPPTNGKVLLKTTAGDIDIELWSKEAPRACRNFVQLCLEGYYDNTIFHRVVPDFIIQGGDPTGTGTGGESVYGKPFRDEFHTRLRFIRRGLVAMANAGPHDNGSQFFFTLGRADELNNKHTIFGKVTGDTIYNLLRLTEVDIGEDERPVNPHKIKTGEVLFNPFDDIVPRVTKKLKKEKQEEESKQAKVKGTKNFSLLSFGEEAEEEEEEVNRVRETMKGKSKSSHDLLKDDPRLSSVPAIESSNASTKSNSESDEEGTSDEEEVDSDEKHQMRNRVSNKLKKDSSKNENPSVKAAEDQPEKSSRSEELRKEARQLKRELNAAKRKKEDEAKETQSANDAKEAERTVANSALDEYLKGKEKYEDCKKKNAVKGSSREQQTLALLDQFKSKLTQAISEPSKEKIVSDIEEDDDKGWMSHVLQFDEKSQKVKDANIQDEDTFEIYDPRNPVNKRRREESKKLMKQKKERR